jgi:hypothetical protein
MHFFGVCLGAWSFFFHMLFLKVYPLGYADICVMHLAAIMFVSFCIAF